MKRTCIGIFAHVDAGKTTLSEAILYRTGIVRTQGRVDDRTSRLDSDEIERKRGITVFGAQAQFTYGGRDFTLLDTPGHADLSAEAERTMNLLDCAVLLISAGEGVRPHTETLWRLLAHYRIPVLIFVNKCDLPCRGKDYLLGEIRQKLSPECPELGSAGFAEAAAMAEDAAMESYLQKGNLSDEEITDLIRRRKLFPVLFGSALKSDGADRVLRALAKYAPMPRFSEAFGCKVWKIRYAEGGERLTFLRLTGGGLRVRDTVTYENAGVAYSEKITRIRVYSGDRFTPAEEVAPGDVCAVSGLSQTAAGMGLGGEKSWEGLVRPYMSCSLILPSDRDPAEVLKKLRQLADEDPTLSPGWDARNGVITLRLMGRIQTEILQAELERRFGICAQIGPGSVIYRETIQNTVEGVGHFEPLRHYAEVHLILRPLPAGEGLRFTTHAPTDELDLNWQRLVLTHLAEKTHLGVLTGSPITDMEICLASGKAHLKHTEGGDFRQATYRAVRQGLMRAQSVLLEPMYTFRLEVPAGLLGRAIADFTRMSCMLFDPETDNDGISVLRGTGPAALLSEYAAEAEAYSGGTARFSASVTHYAPCHNSEEIIRKIGYDPVADVENTPDSVFCAHGSGTIVSWDRVPAFMHLPSALKGRFALPEFGASHTVRPTKLADQELDAILMREFGFLYSKQPLRVPARSAPIGANRVVLPDSVTIRRSIYVVDGYNAVFGLSALAEIAELDLASARQRLIDILGNFSAFTGIETVVVFDGYKVADNGGEKDVERNVTVVYTKEGETGDAYIERFCSEMGRHDNVRVVTSDGLIQLSVFRTGVLRMSMREFEAELNAVDKQIGELL